MGHFNELLARIELALNLGDEPTQEELVEINMNNTEYNGLITLHSMIENDIELLRTYNHTEATPIDLLRFNYVNGYYPLLERFNLSEFLPHINN